MVYSYKNSKGVTYYLHKRGNLYYFSKDKKNALSELPKGYEVVENPRTGLPMLRKKGKK